MENMRREIRTYLAFTPLVYRILVLAVLLCMLIVVRACFCRAVGTGGLDQTFTIFMAYCYITYEVVSDYWLFGGICCKDIGQPLLFRTSFYGIYVLREGITTDLVRRFVWILGYSLAGYVIGGDSREFITGLLMYVAVAASLNLERHTQTPQYLLLSAQPGAVLFLVLRVAGLILEQMYGWPVYLAEFIIFAAAAVGISVLTVWHMMYCIGRSMDAVKSKRERS
ncbi:MAG: hypothetical protein LUE29_12100 [Lachnospiraceae bacterium]|nr:hypothetical protein [Lachnospiraceae bacterium]